MKKTIFNILIIIFMTLVLVGCDNASKNIIPDYDNILNDNIIEENQDDNNKEDDNDEHNTEDNAENKIVPLEFDFATSLINTIVNNVIDYNDSYVLFTNDNQKPFLIGVDGSIIQLNENYTYHKLIDNYIIISDKSNNKGIYKDSKVIIDCKYDKIDIIGNTKLCVKGSIYDIYNAQNDIQSFNKEVSLLSENIIFINEQYCDIKGNPLTIIIDDIKYDIVGNVHNGITKVKYNDRFYYINTNNQLITKESYFTASDFSYGYGIVRKNYKDNLVIINNQGEMKFDCSSIESDRSIMNKDIHILNDSYAIIEYVQNGISQKELINFNDNSKNIYIENDINYSKSFNNYIYFDDLDKYYDIIDKKYIEYRYLQEYKTYYYAKDDKKDYILDKNFNILAQTKKISLNNTFFCYYNDITWLIYKLN